MYEGEWKNGFLHGKGTKYYSNGKIEYEGDWKNGFEDGNGTLNYENGSKMYEGEWRNGQPNGKGVRYAHGRVFSGCFENGKYIRN